MREVLDLKMVKDYINDLKLFILELQFSIENIEELIKVQSEGVNLKPISNFLSHYVFLSYTQIAINVYKLYKPQEKRSFQKLFNKFKNFRFSPDLKKLFIDNSLKDDENLIKNKGQLIDSITKLEYYISMKNELLEKVNSRRQTFYAHTDPDKLNESETLIELKEIMELSKSIYNLLYGKLFGKYYMFEGNITLINEILNDRKFVDEYWKNEEDKLK